MGTFSYLYFQIDADGGLAIVLPSDLDAPENQAAAPADSSEAATKAGAQVLLLLRQAMADAGMKQ